MSSDVSYFTLDDYKLLIKHLHNLTKINNKLPLFYYIENLDMILLKMKSCMFTSEKSIQILQNTNPLSLNFYDIISELKQNILDNNKRMDSMVKYKIEVSMDYSNMINLDHSYDYNINKKNYTEMINEVREIIKIINHKSSGFTMPPQLDYTADF